MNRLRATNSVAFANRDVAPGSGTPQYATDGSPSPLVPPTIWPAYFANMMMDEFCNLVLAAGLALDDTNWAQVLAALSIIAAPVIGSATGLHGLAGGTNALASFGATELVLGKAIGGQPFKVTNPSLSFNGTTTGANGMDTGSMPVSNDLSIYAIYNATTATLATLGCAGSVSNGPVYGGANMPSGYGFSALIHASVTDGSGHFQFFQQRGRTVWMNPSSLILNTTISNNTFSSVSAASAVPACAITCGGDFGASGTGGTNNFFLAGDVNGTGSQQTGNTTTSVTADGSFNRIPLLTAQTLFYKMLNALNAAVQVQVNSFEF